MAKLVLAEITVENGRANGLLDDIFIKRKLADDMSVYLHRSSVTDPSAAPNGDDTFYALLPVPNLNGKSVDWGEITETYRANMAKVINDQMMPGFEDHLSASHIFTPQTFVDR